MKTNIAQKMTALWVVVACGLMMCDPRCYAEEKTHEVRWRGATAVGQQRRLMSVLTHVTRTKVSRRDETLRDHTTKNRLELDGVITVVAVDTSGRPTRVSVRVKQCVYQAGDDKPQPMLAEGAVVVGEVKDGRTVFIASDKKKPLPSLANTLLPKIIALAKRGPDEDAVYGSARRRVGETWLADNKKLVEKLRSLDAAIREDDVSGSAKLEEIVKSGSKQFVNLQFTMQATTKNPGNPPTGMSPVQAKVAVGGALRFPADYATGWTRQSLKIQFDATYRGKPNTKYAGQTMNYRSMQTIEAEAEYLVKAE